MRRGKWRKNPKAPSSLWDSQVLHIAGLHPGTLRAVDESGLENHGTLTGYADASAAWNSSPEIGRHYTAHTGLGSGQSIPLSRGIGRNSYLIPHYYAAWIYPTTTTVYQWVLNNGVANDGSSLCVVVNSGTMRTAFFYQGGGSVKFGTTAIPLNQWSHIATVYRSDRVKLFTNGLLDSEPAATAFSASTAESAVGRWWSGAATKFEFGGRIADVIAGAQIASQEIEWLANPANRLYVPDTRLVVRFPSGLCGPLIGSRIVRNRQPSFIAGAS